MCSRAKMAKYIFNLPDVGEGVVEGEIVKWNVKPGDTVKKDEPLVEIMTDKATVAIPSTVNGKVVSTTGTSGDMIPVGGELIVFEVDGQDDEIRVKEALKREKYLDYDKAIEIYEEINMPEEAARVRKLKAKQGAVKVDQTVVHGNYIDDRDTIVKDSVISKSNIGAGGKSKAEEIKEIKELLDSDAIDDDEFKQMKKEILGK